MRFFVVLIATLLASCAAAPAGAQVTTSYEEIHQPVYGRAGMIAAQNVIASQIGAEVLAKGGNAVDAAVAVAFALQVTLPRAGNIGGGGFMLVYDAESDSTVAIDYRETAPLAATRDMFLDEHGNADPDLSRYSHKAAGVPGTVAGLYVAHQKYGRLPWKRLVQPAVDLARNGIVVSKDLSSKLLKYKARLCKFEAACGYYFKEGGEPYEFGERLVQSDLADTLALIAEQGPDVFYRGEIADKIIAEMEAGGGLIDRESLASYEPVIRKPVRGQYRGYEIVSMPPSSSGGVHILQMLNILEHFPVAEIGSGSADKAHLLAEVMRLAYADRSKHLGDPDYYPVPVEWLTSENYAAELAASIDMQKARPSTDVAPGVSPPHESEDTTQFSIADEYGNFVSNTYTLNLSYGSGIAVTGAGFLLNDEMDDFVSKPDVPNAFGLLGDKANAIEAGKRPLSSMSPVIVFADGEPWFATGSPGGSRIISTVLQMIVNVIDHGMNIAAATHRPRMHHQWFPDVLMLEPGFSPDTVKLLEERGHRIQHMKSLYTSLQTVAIKNGLFQGASDPRLPNAASVAPMSVDANGD
jgi:gamma-glutamyltranspeptidase/glutathione hydrolase